MTDFDGSQVPMVPGSLLGLRSFDIAGGGELDSLYKSHWWKDGENVGKCTSPYTKHRAGAKKCSCGFYAYYLTEQMSHISPASVLGVIEGYGRTTLGSLGFRAEKARIVALYDPHRATTRYPDPTKVAGRTKSQRFMKALLGFANHPAVLRGQVAIMAAVMVIILGDIVWGFGVVADIAPWVSLAICMWAIFTIPLRIYAMKNWGRDLYMSGTMFMMRGNPLDPRLSSIAGRAIEEGAYRRMARIYQVPIYGSVTEMLREHPLTEYNDVKHL